MTTNTTTTTDTITARPAAIEVHDVHKWFAGGRSWTG